MSVKQKEMVYLYNEHSPPVGSMFIYSEWYMIETTFKTFITEDSRNSYQYCFNVRLPNILQTKLLMMGTNSEKQTSYSS